MTIERVSFFFYRRLIVHVEKTVIHVMKSKNWFNIGIIRVRF